MLLRTMIWTLVIIAVVVVLWCWYQGSWYHSLFKATPDCVCENLNADQALER